MEHIPISEIPIIQKVGIYGIHNKKTERYYIGSTSNIYKRLYGHSCKLKQIKGINNKMIEDIRTPEQYFDFEWIIIETFEDCELTEEELRKKERQYVIKYNAISNGYNTAFPGALKNKKRKVKSKQYLLKENQDRMVVGVPKSDFMATDAKRKAIAKYHAKLDEIKVRVPKGDRK